MKEGGKQSVIKMHTSAFTTDGRTKLQIRVEENRGGMSEWKQFQEPKARFNQGEGDGVF